MKMYLGVLLLGLVSSTSLQAFELPSEFSNHWYDGKAELAGYDYTIRRYGQEREGTAVSIFVTEPFNFRTSVKSDRPKGQDIANVMKLNLVIDFPTGVYDYNTMLSVFSGVAEQSYGKVDKVTFSSQEWCGHTWQQMLFTDTKLSGDVHSYFEGEERAALAMDIPDGGLSEDALMHWARGLASPEVKPGQSVNAKTLRAAKLSRLGHSGTEWRDAKLSRAKKTTKLTVPAGEFEVREAVAKISSDIRYVFWVEAAHPHRIIKWELEHPSLGESAQLIGIDRFAYWGMNSNKYVEALAKIGMKKRPSRTP